MAIDEREFEGWRRAIQNILRTLNREAFRSATATNILITEIAKLKGTDGGEIRAELAGLLMDAGFSSEDADSLDAARQSLEDLETGGTIQ